MFWFYGHPVVYIMFFPFIGAVMEVLSTFAGRRLFGYKGTVLALLGFAAGSMAVWGHHMFATDQVVNDYYSLTSNLLSIPAGIEYFAMLGTLIGGRLRYRTPMLFALAFIPQFLIGGPQRDTGRRPGDRLQRQRQLLHRRRTSTTRCSPAASSACSPGSTTGCRRPPASCTTSGWAGCTSSSWSSAPTWPSCPCSAWATWACPGGWPAIPGNEGLNALNLTSSIGAFIIGLSMLVFAYNLYLSKRRRVPAPPDPWQGHTLEWATSSPPPRFNFSSEFPVPKIRSYAPLLDIREARAGSPAARSSGAGQAPDG